MPIMMMNNNFLSGSANINSLDDKAKDHNIILKTEQNNKIENIRILKYWSNISECNPF